MDQLAVFLEAIRANEDDDVPRLVYADWLDEQGDPRGEFIRVQCEIARLETTGEAPVRLRELRQLEWDLLKEYKDEWTAPLDRWRAFVRFHRGLVDEASFHTVDFVENAPHILEAVPTLTHLRLRMPQRHITELAQVPELSNLTGLELPVSFPARDDLQTLLHSPHLTRLCSLSFANCLLRWNLNILASSPVLPQITHLNLEGNRLDQNNIEWLLNSLQPGQMQSLNLARNNLDESAVGLIARYDWENQLQELDLSRNRLGLRGMQELAYNPHAKSLKALKLSGCGVQSAGLMLLEESAGFPSLQSVDLSNNSIETSLQALSNCGGTAGLRDIDLSRNPIDHYELENLFAVIDPSLLVRLNLSRTRIGSGDTSAVNLLGHGEPLPRLRELDISYCDLNPQNVARLVSSRQFDSLERLILSGNHLNDYVAEQLLNSSFLDRLLWLQVFPPRPQWWTISRLEGFRTPPWKKLKKRMGDRVDIPERE